MNFKVYFPITDDMSPITYNVSDTRWMSKEEDALWHYNDSRDHDHLAPLQQLPKGVEFIPVF